MKKISLILILSVLCACAGTAVAYYNTASLGYNSANIISFYDGGINVFDFDINYEKTERELKRILKRFPERFVSI